MKATIKIAGRLLDRVLADLHRPHPFAHERVGFLTSGAAAVHDRDLLLLVRDYLPVEDSDYLRNPAVGAMIGPNAMRKGLQAAYKSGSALLHIHSHGGVGMPGFSGTDLKDGANFVPSFFNVVPHMPHGLIVLSGNSACALIWYAADKPARYAAEFIRVGSPYRRFGGVS